MATEVFFTEKELRGQYKLGKRDGKSETKAKVLKIISKIDWLTPGLDIKKEELKRQVEEI